MAGVGVLGTEAGDVGGLAEDLRRTEHAEAGDGEQRRRQPLDPASDLGLGDGGGELLAAPEQPAGQLGHHAVAALEQGQRGRDVLGAGEAARRGPEGRVELVWSCPAFVDASPLANVESGLCSGRAREADGDSPRAPLRSGLPPGFPRSGEPIGCGDRAAAAAGVTRASWSTELGVRSDEECRPDGSYRHPAHPKRRRPPGRAPVGRSVGVRRPARAAGSRGARSRQPPDHDAPGWTDGPAFPRPAEPPRRRSGAGGGGGAAEDCWCATYDTASWSSRISRSGSTTGWKTKSVTPASSSAASRSRQ